MKKNNEKFPQIDNDNDYKMSRRAFLSNTGKLIGLGILSHFTLIGKTFADSITAENNNSSKATCNMIQTNSCDKKAVYTCTSTEKHTCGNRFSCATFTCTPTSANNCTTNANNCIPVHTFNKPE